VVQVALALFLVGGLSAVRLMIVVIAQFVGGIAAAAVVSALFPGPMAVATTLGGGANVPQGLFIEMFLTAQLVFVIIMVAVEKHKATYLAPIAIGLAFFLAELVGMCIQVLSTKAIWRTTPELVTDWIEQAFTSPAARSIQLVLSARPSSTAASLDTSGSTG
jgi:glycerol uptake facilitator-like aquaporin